MPRFSIIVPAYQVQAYLPACLTSVLAQDFADVELLVVDDASPDACGEIIAEFAAADARVTGLRHARTEGPGPARNTALERATGDYVLFLDGDDTLTPGALTAVAAHLDATGHPQLLVTDHAVLSFDGTLTPGLPADLLARRGPDVGPLTARPSLLRLPPTAWGRAYRRDFLLRRDLRFPPGHHQDIPFAYPALIAAESIAVLDRVCLHHRARRRGGRTHGPGPGHADLVEQYERAFALLPSPRWRAALYRRMAEHLSAVHRTPGLLPADVRPDFFRRSAALCRRHRTAAGATALGARQGGAHVLFRLGARRAFRLASALQRLGGRLRATARGAVRAVRALALRAHYRCQLRLPLDTHLAVFTAGRGGRYGCHPAAIEAKLRELATGIRTAWVAGPGQTLPHGVRRLTPGTAAYWSALARARYLVSNSGFPDVLADRPGQLRLQTHQGTPLAHRGLDTPVRDVPRLLRQIDTWDYCLSANRHSTLAWEAAYPADFVTLEYGSPRADVFHTASVADVLRARARLGVPDGVLAVLYAPAPRAYAARRRSPLDLALLARALGPRFRLLAATDDALEEQCLAADALVTDYAPVLFDYAALDRPVVVHADDWETYRTVHGAYFDLPAAAPGPVTRTAAELTAVLTDPRLWTDPGLAARRAAFRQRFCPYDDGLAAERVVRTFFLDGRDVPPVIPAKARRPVPGAVAVAAPRRPSAQGRIPREFLEV
ncbi:bifunctional glycosyltransferase/CDP-glycerol:glycerophosphate glycerophosphotransferase [Streptomyces avicenniae]|uniref:bifunctional glycosyltransferase/CDP-glycerol:glycerophosphate glycerophosphotransferase n=1 Tax=Streptomyces avicenniae TaxID=500153 RepID=UPI000AA6B8C1|nr:bifunctional glycosyltransferase family 2 protein/CDP-glycerol:glycerophosphate glycerophosphotransferase [Streptomyces avicenniae]